MHLQRIYLPIIASSILLFALWFVLPTHVMAASPTKDISTAAIQGQVWNDQNDNGMQDAEPGIGGITVELLNVGQTVLMSTTTNVEGRYVFTSLMPAQYFIQVLSPPGGWVTPSHRTDGVTNDNDIDHMGQVGPFQLTTGITKTVNAGYIFVPLLATELSDGGISYWEPDEGPITYTVSLSNNGEGPAFSSVLHVVLDYHAAIDLARSSPDWACTYNDDVASTRCDIWIGTLAPDDTYQTTLVTEAILPLAPDMNSAFIGAYPTFSPQLVCGCSLDDQAVRQLGCIFNATLPTNAKSHNLCCATAYHSTPIFIRYESYFPMIASHLNASEN